MPSSLTYPGVYIEEIPSGVRTLTGVATSITAFVGRATRGPTDDPALINSWADYERRFGGLAVDCTMSYAVRDFYLNGGSQAVIVRVAPDDAVATQITLDGGGSPATDLVLEVASVGSYGDRFGARVNHDSDKELLESAASPPTSPPPTDPTRFNLVLFETTPDGDEVVLEQYLGVSTDAGHARFVTRVLESQSSVARVSGAVPATRPLAATGTRTRDGEDGGDLTDADVLGSELPKTGLYALLKADLFNLLCIPPRLRGGVTSPSVWQAAARLCELRRAFLVVDPDPAWAANIDTAVDDTIDGRDSLGITGPRARNAALYAPLVRQVDPLRDGQVAEFPPSGLVAGIFARTDSTRGVWKAPAGLDAALGGVHGLQQNFSDLENGRLNQLGINCLRTFPVHGRVIWGARTLRGADQSADEEQGDVPVRRLALFLEESLLRGTQWVVFEPNDEPLWGQIRLAVGAFMQNLFRQGAFQGQSPREAYLVKCDKETTTQDDINRGVVNILVGFAPLKPAEFVVLRIQQLAGQVQA